MRERESIAFWGQRLEVDEGKEREEEGKLDEGGQEGREELSQAELVAGREARGRGQREGRVEICIKVGRGEKEGEKGEGMWLEGRGRGGRGGERGRESKGLKRN